MASLLENYYLPGWTAVVVVGSHTSSQYSTADSPADITLTHHTSSGSITQSASYVLTIQVTIIYLHLQIFKMEMYLVRNVKIYPFLKPLLYRLPPVEAVASLSLCLCLSLTFGSL